MAGSDDGEAAAIAAIGRAKARYLRGVDLCDGDLVRSVLAEDCVLDYVGCCTDPITGANFLPAMDVVMRGRDSWLSAGLSALGIVSVHHCYTPDIVLTGDGAATGIWAMTDRLWMPPGSAYALLTGHGHYHEAYERVGADWLIKTLRITRIRIDVS